MSKDVSTLIVIAFVVLLLGLLVGVAIGPAAGWVEPQTGVVVGNWLAFPGRLFLVVAP